MSLLSPLAYLSGRARGVPILMYHYVGDAPAPEDRPYFVSTAAFTAQMAFLSERRYRALTLHELLGAFATGSALPARAVVITFDDGHESFERLAVPIMRTHGFKASMFVITSKIGANGFIGADSIRALSDEGFEFGSHSHTHPILTKLGDREVSQELTESKAVLEAIVSGPVKYFCYRGGHFDERVKALVRASGYAGAVCSRPGLNDAQTDALELRRMGIRGADDLRSFGNKLSGRTATTRLQRFGNSISDLTRLPR